MKIISEICLSVIIWYAFCAAWEYVLKSPDVRFPWVMLYGYFAGIICDSFRDYVLRNKAQGVV